MKALNLIIALLLCTQAYGQDFDFDDLKVIDSEKAFKRFCFENEFVLVEKKTYEMTYAFDYTRSTESAVMWVLHLDYGAVSGTLILLFI